MAHSFGLEKELTALALLVVLIVCAPMGVIWAVNVLLGVALPITFKTWFAVLVLLVVLRAK